MLSTKDTLLSTRLVFSDATLGWQQVATRRIRAQELGCAVPVLSLSVLALAVALPIADFPVVNNLDLPFWCRGGGATNSAKSTLSWFSCWVCDTPTTNLASAVSFMHRVSPENVHTKDKIDEIIFPFSKLVRASLIGASPTTITLGRQATPNTTCLSRTPRWTDNENTGATGGGRLAVRVSGCVCSCGLEETMLTIVGIRLHQGNTRV